MVDDSADDRLLIERAFRKAGITNPMATVKNGLEAIQYLSGEGPYADRNQFPLPAVIFLDLKMPLKNGFEVLAWIRSQPHLAPTRVVMLTDSTDKNDIAKACHLGASSYLIKPFELGELANLIATAANFWLAKATLPQTPSHRTDALAFAL